MYDVPAMTANVVQKEPSMHPTKPLVHSGSSTVRYQAIFSFLSLSTLFGFFFAMNL